MVEEGKEYLFRIEKETTTPDNKTFWVLSGPGEKRFLLPSGFYKEYGFEPGKEITCRIDRINCSGQVFLEPKHPYYEEGKKYPFRVISAGETNKENGNGTVNVLVEDILGNKITVEQSYIGESPVTGKEIFLRIERIYKGKPVFVPKNKTRLSGRYRTGKYYDFTVLRTRRGPDNELYYIVSDSKGAIHSIPVRYYEHYNIKDGTIFRGRIIKYSSGGVRIIEPKSPFYKPGTFIRLKVLNVFAEPGHGEVTLELRDKHGFIHFIKCNKPPMKEYIRGKIIRIKKGKPEINLL